MKRSIKFAGIAAATLLAVAPVATTTVSAASSAVTFKSNEISVKDALAKFSNQTLAKSEVINNDDKSNSIGTSGNVTLAKLIENKDDAGNARLTDLTSKATQSPKIDVATPTYLSMPLDTNFTSDVKDTDVIAIPMGNTSVGDFDNTVRSRRENGGSFTYRIVMLDSTKLDTTDSDYAKNSDKTLNELMDNTDYVKGSKEVTITIDDVKTNATSLDVNFDQPSKAVLGSQVVDSMLTSSNHKGLSITDQTGKEVKGYTIASTDSDAYKADSSDKDDTDAAMRALGATTSNDGFKVVSSNDVFKKAGNYFQAVTFKFDNNVKELRNMITNDRDVTVNGVTLNAANENSVWTAKDATGTDKAELTVVNKIEVGTDYYTDAKDKGVATVTNEDRAQVYNYSDSKHAMVPVSGKKFDKDSKWYTDIKRTLTIDGSTYRRVSTNEWLKTSDVSFDAAK